MNGLPAEVRNLSPESRYGYCKCGCGRKTTIPQYSNHNKNWERGVPLPFCNGHFRRNPIRYEVDAVTGCWNWLATLSTNGYAAVYIGRKRYTVHRLVFELLRGSVPAHLDLDHLCRNRRCINPDHLRIATRHENSQCGAMAKLTPETVRQVRSLRVSGKSMGAIGRQLGVSTSTVQGVLEGRTWRNIL